jgi:hypothetical protein
VSIYDERTLQVAVSEGVVLLHRRGSSPVRIKAGEVWRPAPEAPVAAQGVQEPPAVASSDTTLAPPETSARPGPHVQASRHAPAVHARSFEPSMLDEDASYLRTLALLRQGRELEAQLAAVEYLSRFPSGFRRAEMARIAARR